MRRKCAPLLAILLLAGLLAVSAVLTWREVRQEQLNHALTASVGRNDLVAVRSLLRQGADPNAQVLLDDKRPLWKRLWEILSGHRISSGGSGVSVLEEAIDWHATVPYDAENPETVRALVEAGARVNVPTRFHSFPLLIAIPQWNTVKVLIAHGADVNAVDWSGQTALMQSAYWSNPEMLELLLNRQARVNARDRSGQTALMWSLIPGLSTPKSRQAIVANLLRHGASVQDADAEGNTALALARKYWQDPQLIQKLKQAGAK